MKLAEAAGPLDVPPQPASLLTPGDTLAFHSDHCPVCAKATRSSGNRTMTLRSRGRAITWLLCRGCSSWFQTSQYDSGEEVHHTRKTAWGQQESGLKLNQYKARMFRAVLRSLEKYSTSPGRLLDVGCSYGGFLLLAREAGYEVFGTDIVPEAVDYVRNQGIPAETSASVGDLKELNGLQDVVSVLDCNCYWPDHGRELRFIHAKLSDQGLLVLRTPAKSWMLRAGLAVKRLAPSVGAKICARAVNDHRTCISLPSYLRIFETSGFEVLSASPDGAMHADRSTFGVKLGFAVGSLVWKLTGRNVAPGFLIVCRKRAESRQ